MGKKQKIGKARRDKFYHLAKETGYRARSAFKLIQLNRKFNFLSKSRVLIDLCAAPGGWLQVASNFMPLSSIIVGVDLVSIKPIKNVTTFTSDITTETCRQQLKKELKTWKADCVLNDGAPNVGTAWVQDAFTQAQLTLSALKLACEFLNKGGWFITKVFRSKDYANLLVTFRALFKRVHATKPQASRNESAEIFVVCQGFLAPAKLDQKLLDIKHVFKEAEDTKKQKIDIFKPEKHKRQRDGYEEGNYTLFTSNKVSEFMSCDNPIEMLSTTSQLILDDEIIASHFLTTQEIKLCCEDIKVLGKKELKNILTWRKKIRKEEEAKKADGKESEEPSESNKETEEETEEALDKMIKDLKEEEKHEAKRKKKHVREMKKKLSERLGKKAAGDNNDALEMDLFRLSAIKSKEHLGKVESKGEDQDDNDDEEVYHEDDEDALEFELDGGSSNGEESDEDNELYDDDMFGPKRPNMEDESIKLTQEQKKVVEDLKKKHKKSEAENPLLVNVKVKEGPDKTSQWFKKDVFKSIEDEEEEAEDYDIEQIMKDHKKKGDVIIGEQTNEKPENDKDTVKSKKSTESLKSNEKDEKQGEDMNVDDEGESDDDDDDDDDSDSGDSEIDDRSISQGRPKPENKTQGKEGSFEVVSQKHQAERYLTPEALALGAAMATSRKRKRDIIDDAYNRYSYGEEEMPSWFADEEKKHTSIQLPISREDVFYYKERLKAINARPMKKVMEAQARKKRKTMKKMEKVRKKADTILDTQDVSEKEKMYQIKSIYKNAGLLNKKKVEKKYVVAKKGLAGKRYPRPSGVKGLYKVVDPRMKKDLRAMKNKDKTKNRGKKGKGKRGR
ncbi:pre-rRNA 2'-O-ribose RNA methyltransferase FTSJ3-like [Rhopilema esculentum]|uniref:pre-rRNA 2'-O-ribose RNA methyltransferase FTSJ3-like n=1 Tax=Rhopilema esculentum TaxID=499914 RepID=UPI0031D6B4BB